MKRAVHKKKRVTVHLSPKVYALFHRFAESRSWSDGKAGAQVIEASLTNSLPELLEQLQHVRVDRLVGNG